MPGSFGWGSAVLAAITIFAPSRAAFKAIAFPMPREAPVMKIVFSFNLLKSRSIYCVGLTLSSLPSVSHILGAKSNLCAI